MKKISDLIKIIFNHISKNILCHVLQFNPLIFHIYSILSGYTLYPASTALTTSSNLFVFSGKLNFYYQKVQALKKFISFIIFYQALDKGYSDPSFNSAILQVFPPSYEKSTLVIPLNFDIFKFLDIRIFYIFWILAKRIYLPPPLQAYPLTVASFVFLSI